ncbi:MAG: response regulator [Thermoanaerobaculia bacterium]
MAEPTILVVEDNLLNQEVLQRRLKKAGFTVTIAADGKQGVDRALAEKPDLIIMDMTLPVMDGFEATRRIKADPETCRIPIIALTALMMPGDRELCLGAGCDDYDGKPVDFPVLLSKIRALLG